MSGSRKQARYLRNNSTYPEVKLWNCLKQDQIGFMFKRQWLLGGYILDFYCSELKLAIEIDGKIHGLKLERDKVRDLYLASEGVHLVRIPARKVYRNALAVAMHLKDICEQLEKGVFETDGQSTECPPMRNASLDKQAGMVKKSNVHQREMPLWTERPLRYEAGESIERSEFNNRVSVSHQSLENCEKLQKGVFECEE